MTPAQKSKIVYRLARDGLDRANRTLIDSSMRLAGYKEGDNLWVKNPDNAFTVSPYARQIDRGEERVKHDTLEVASWQQIVDHVVDTFLEGTKP